jgi:hypothetical protein
LFERPQNPSKGEASPGPSTLRIKRGLQLNKDYRGVNREVWTIFHKMYGGGPVLVREDLDIYSKDLSNDLNKPRFQRGKGSSGSKKNLASSSSVGSVTNIFAAGASAKNQVPSITHPSGQSNLGSLAPQGQKIVIPKKRNLFQSENIGMDDEGALFEGIPEEQLELNLLAQQHLKSNV